MQRLYMEIGLRVGGGYDKSLMCFSDLCYIHLANT